MQILHTTQNWMFLSPIKNLFVFMGELSLSTIIYMYHIYMIDILGGNISFVFSVIDTIGDVLCIVLFLYMMHFLGSLIIEFL